jgi:hypothetical protein
VRSKFLVAVFAGAALVGLTGCNSGPTTTGSTASDPAPPTSTTSKPEISNPLNTAKFAADTCSGLTDAQIAPYLGVPRSKSPAPADNGPGCALLSSSYSGPTIGISVVNIAAPTQDLLYQTFANFPWRQKISPISGYPAIDGSNADTSQKGDCITAAAVNDKQSVQVQFTATQSSDSNYLKPCTVSEALAAQLVQNIQAEGS